MPIGDTRWSFIQGNSPTRVNCQVFSRFFFLFKYRVIFRSLWLLIKKELWKKASSDQVLSHVYPQKTTSAHNDHLHTGVSKRHFRGWVVKLTSFWGIPDVILGDQRPFWGWPTHYWGIIACVARWVPSVLLIFAVNIVFWFINLLRWVIRMYGLFKESSLGPFYIETA